MAVVASRTTIPQSLLTCPACHDEVEMRFVVEVDAQSASTPAAADQPREARINLIGKVIGMQVSHDCVPPVTR